jgi:hypothetical protein
VVAPSPRTAPVYASTNSVRSRPYATSTADPGAARQVTAVGVPGAAARTRASSDSAGRRAAPAGGAETPTARASAQAVSWRW